MKGKLLFVAGLATGYVAGSRAGRSAYTRLTEKLRTASSSDAVHSVVVKVRGVAEERAPRLAATVSSVADTTASVTEAAATAPDPESDGSDTSAPPKASRGAKRGGGSGSTGAAGETAEEAARVFEEQLPESGGAIDDSASSLPPTAGAADESETPTATS